MSRTRAFSSSNFSASSTIPQGIWCRVAVIPITLLLSLPLISVGWAEDVRDFGAVGDGETDDTEAIERAVDETQSGQLQFPQGDYRITRTIEIDLSQVGRRSLDGMGGVGRVVMAGAGPAFRFIGTHDSTASPSGFSQQTWDKERMPQIDGLEILGAHQEADGIEFVRVMQPTLHGVLIREVRNGVILSTRNRNLLIDACHIYNCSGIGVFFDRVNLHQSIIQASHISYCKGGGIKIVDGEIRNFQVTGNDIEYNYDANSDESADIWFDIANGTVAEGTIASNTIQARVSPGGANIRFVGPESSSHRTPMSMWTISGNLIGNQEVNLHLVRCRGMAITGNHIYSGNERTLMMEDCRNMIVGDNSLDQSHNSGRGFTNGVTIRSSEGVNLSGLILDQCAAGSDESGGAIEIFDSRRVTVTDCQLLEPAVRGIWSSGSGGLQITGNTVVNGEDEHELLSAIEVQEPTGTTIVRGNIVTEGIRGAVVSDSDRVVVGDNPAER